MCWLPFVLGAAGLFGACRERVTSPIPEARPAISTGDGGSRRSILNNPADEQEVCTPYSLRCEGAAFEKCSPDGSAFVTFETCQSAELCEVEPGGCAPAHCIAEEMTCQGASLLVCNDSRAGFAAFALCETAAHCNSVERRCLQSPCESGDMRCNRLLFASPDRRNVSGPLWCAATTGKRHSRRSTSVPLQKSVKLVGPVRVTKA